MKNTYLLIVFIFLYFTGFPAISAATSPPEGMVLVPKGCFLMGSNQIFDYEGGRKNYRERPVHKVCIDAFYLDKYEANQEKFQSIMGFNPSIHISPILAVDHVKWEDAKHFCKKQGKRLPFEAEWEYAARAGSSKENPWGNGVNGDYLWYERNSARKPNPPGTKKPNAWGLHDMMGSVWEWVEDWFSESYYKESPMQNPKGPQKRLSFRVIRGGSWIDDKSFIRVAVRYQGMQDGTETFLVGVRCAQDIK